MERQFCYALSPTVTLSLSPLADIFVNFIIPRKGKKCGPAPLPRRGECPRAPFRQRPEESREPRRDEQRVVPASCLRRTYTCSQTRECNSTPRPRCLVRQSLRARY